MCSVLWVVVGFGELAAGSSAGRPMGDRCEKLLPVDRFGGVVVAARVKAFLAVLGHGVRGQGDDRAGIPRSRSCRVAV